MQSVVVLFFLCSMKYFLAALTTLIIIANGSTTVSRKRITSSPYFHLVSLLLISRNRQFIALLICIALAFFVYIAASLVFIIRYSLNSGDLINHVIWYFSNPDTLKSGFIVTCVFCGIMVLMAVLDLNLLVYHIWLIKNKLTTYEHIIMKRKMEITRLPQEGQVLIFSSWI